MIKFGGIMAKQKYYVVWEGLKSGIFTSWEDCKKQIHGVQGAKYKSFTSREEAEIALKKGWKSYYRSTKNSNKQSNTVKKDHANLNTDYMKESISVDAACSGNPGAMEYKGVYTKTGKELFHFGPILGTNNIGEFLAIVHGLAYLQKKNLQIPIYSDSQTAIKWVKMKKVNTSLALTKDTEQVWKLIRQGEQWLKKNTYTNQIIKWETERWGENKADFGRK